MTSALKEAIDYVELEGCVIGLLQDAVSFLRNTLIRNCRNRTTIVKNLHTILNVR